MIRKILLCSVGFAFCIPALHRGLGLLAIEWITNVRPQKYHYYFVRLEPAPPFILPALVLGIVLIAAGLMLPRPKRPVLEVTHATEP